MKTVLKYSSTVALLLLTAVVVMASVTIDPQGGTVTLDGDTIVNGDLTVTGNSNIPGVIQTKTLNVSIADLQGLGFQTQGSIDFGSSLPAGAVLIQARPRNNGSAITPTFGTLNNLSCFVVASGHVVALTGSCPAMHLAATKGVSLTLGAGFDQTDNPYVTGYTPAVRFLLSGTVGLSFMNLQGGASGLTIDLYYFVP